MAPVPPLDFLFAAIALHLGALSRDQIVAAFEALPAAAPPRSLPDYLVEAGLLSAASRTLIQAVVAAHLEKYGNDPARAVAALSSLGSAVQSLSTIANPEVQATVVTLNEQGSQAETAPFPTPATTAKQTSQQPHDAPTEAHSSERSTSVGSRIRIIRPHKTGGLGEVYLAHDEELGRNVALKQIRSELSSSPTYRSRFLLEAEITSNLEHPGVVPVYGLGCFPDGRPFYVMRFVQGNAEEGDTLAEAIALLHDKGNPLPPRQREFRLRQLLGRFVDVCDAIAHAHVKGVLHRDLKPSNILLGKYGETLLIDWGLAKATGRPDLATEGEDASVILPHTSSVNPTAAGQRLGTPGHMAPEQIKGELHKLKPTTDVYALGIILYAILTGKSPFPGKSREEIDRKVLAGDFPPPRVRQPGVPRPLDAICLKAMALEPADRYATALDMAEDVERWLGDQPVSVYQEPWTTRVQRWGRRHRTLVTSGALLLIGSLLATSAGLYFVNQERLKTDYQREQAELQRVRAERQTAETERHFQEARALAAALVETAEQRLSQRAGNELVRKALFETAGPHYDKLVQARPNDFDLQHEAGMAHLYHANLLRLINDQEAAEARYASAISALERAIQLAPDNLALQDRLAEAFRDRALLAQRSGKVIAARDLMNKARSLCQATRARDPQSLAFLRTEASIWLELPEMEANLGRDAEAEQYARGAVERWREVVLRAEPDPAPAQAQATPSSSSARLTPLLFLMALNRHAYTLRQLGRLEDALAVHQEASLLSDRITADSTNPDFRVQRGRTLVERGRTERLIPDKKTDAETHLNQAITLLEDLIKTDERTSVRTWYGLAHQNLAILRAEQNRAEEARQLFSLAEARLARNAQVKPSVPPRFLVELADLLAEQASFEASQGNTEKAAVLHSQALARLQEATQAAPENVAYRRELDRLKTLKPKTDS